MNPRSCANQVRGKTVRHIASQARQTRQLLASTPPYLIALLSSLDLVEQIDRHCLGDSNDQSTDSRVAESHDT